MRRKRQTPDHRLNVARYEVDKLTPGSERTEAHHTDQPAAAEGQDVAAQTSMDRRAHYVEILIQQAMRRGDFDDLPGAGKPLTDLHDVHDPDWWIRRKIEREGLSGLGPPALTLRTESARLEQTLDAAPTEHSVREILLDFNSRVIEARRQLLGGPPVVTPTRDIEAEVQAWRERRTRR